MCGLVARECGDLQTAQKLTPYVLKEFHRIGTRWETVSALNDCAMLAFDLQKFDLAAQLFGAADALGEKIQFRLVLSVKDLRDPREAELRRTLGEDAYLRQHQQGAQMSLDAAIALAQTI
jgi:hypothetical protein